MEEETKQTCTLKNRQEKSVSTVYSLLSPQKNDLCLIYLVYMIVFYKPVHDTSLKNSIIVTSLVYEASYYLYDNFKPRSFLVYDEDFLYFFQADIRFLCSALEKKGWVSKLFFLFFF